MIHGIGEPYTVTSIACQYCRTQVLATCAFCGSVGNLRGMTTMGFVSSELFVRCAECGKEQPLYCPPFCDVCVRMIPADEYAKILEGFCSA